MEDLTHQRKTLDLPTLGLFLLCLALFVLAFYLATISIYGMAAATLLGTFAMNATFTLWHETSHHNFSRYLWANHLLGIFSSQLTLYPGYFFRRREHLAHHRWEGDPERDPVFPRIQSSLPAMFKLTLQGMKKNCIPADFLPLSSLQKKMDAGLIFVSVMLCLLSLIMGQFLSFFFALILPRAIIWVLHAWYICYLPHSVKGGGFQKYRIVSSSFFARFFTIEQSLHGVHHRSPSIPWYKYNSALKQRGDSWLE